jgi:hypothetical protein
MTSEVAVRFWDKVNISSDDACWEWKAAINVSGYGWFSYLTRSTTAHRVSAHLNGLIEDIKSPLHVLHKCDNRKCCNPNHLFVGTNTDNVKDRVAKNRSGNKPMYGESNGMAKLSNDAIKTIRGLYFAANFSQSQLAKMYGVRQPHISRIVNKVKCGGVI